LTRDLEKKTNEELGEGAEVDLFEALREEFPVDNLKRVKKGEPAADIVHVVILQGRECGTIVYDSKNHKQYRTDHVAKLRVDQLAHDADHAILSTHKFPQGTRQLHTIDGILLANPARVVQLAILLRRHLVQVYIHRQRKEWDAKEKEIVAYRLVDLMGRASAANILGITVRELDKLVEIFEVSERFTALRDPSAAITWARELMGVGKKLLVPSVVDAVVKKVNQKRITNSKDLRKLRSILPDPVAKAEFLSDTGDLESAQVRVRAPEKKQAGLLVDLSTAVAAHTTQETFYAASGSHPLCPRFEYKHALNSAT
jgi:hypothetical protein